MNFSELKEFLWKENPIEMEQRLQGYNVNDQNLPFDKEVTPKMPKSHFFSEGNIFINKHHRYSAMPDHTHEFVEFNYMLSGSCIQYVNEEKVVLSAGEILLLDKEIVQRIEPLGKDDILINILLKDDSISTDILVNMVKTNGIVNEFLMNASNQYGKHDAYLHFHTGKNLEVQQTLQQLILEYYNKRRYYMRAVNLQLSLLLINLSRSFEAENLEDQQPEDEEIIQILRYIERNYQKVTSKDLATKFRYNANYMSNKLKRETGHTFQELLNTTRYHAALQFMQETTMSFEEIAYEIGFASLPSLYKLFSRFTDKTPKELREQFNKINL